MTLDFKPLLGGVLHTKRVFVVFFLLERPYKVDPLALLKDYGVHSKGWL